jgi:FAD/FMN-containing dehydrogenase
MSVGPGPDMAAAEFESFRAQTIGAIDKLIWEFCGTISAEHGVGVENMNRIVGQKPPVEREYMAAVRRLFDPKGLFNPGKVIDPDAALHVEQLN